ncbi:PAP2 superfamily-domain-containing protein [Xylaria sp. CBS 124048]|nr:PAP2 superfamily-domain-containing protein [Xylaria sp. CBS 124048]
MDRPPPTPGSTRSPAINATVPQSRRPSIAKTLSRYSICSTREPYTVEKRPTFGQWIKITWLDLLTIFTIGAFAFPIYYFARPFGVRMFPLDDVGPNGSFSTLSEASVIPPGLAYPARHQLVPNWLITIVAIAFPTLVMLLMQIRVRNFWDLNNCLLGFCYALLISAAFQGTIKAFIGGLRPNFYDVCQPDSSQARNGGNKTGLNGIGLRKNMWTLDVCTTANERRLRNAMQAFPSGHSTTMTAAMVYLCLYLNAKLKVFANYHTPLWKLVALVVPLLGTVLLCGTLIIDNTHSWYDIAGGVTIGFLVALAAFRMVYASLFDWRFNHIPLNRNAPFDGSSRSDFVATTRAGWQAFGAENDGDSGGERKAGHEGSGGESGGGTGRNPL